MSKQSGEAVFHPVMLKDRIFSVVGEQVAEALLAGGFINDEWEPRSPLTEDGIAAMLQALAEGLYAGLSTVEFVQNPGAWIDEDKIVGLLAETMAPAVININNYAIEVDFTDGLKNRGALVKSITVPLPRPTKQNPFIVVYTSTIRMLPDPKEVEIIPDFPRAGRVL